MRTRLLLSGVALLAACGGGAATISPPPPPPPAPVATVTLSPNAATIMPGQTATFAATTKDATGNTLSGRTVTWSSSASAVATVNGGVVTAVAVGSATITATSEGQGGTAAITVAAAIIPVATVTLNQSAATLVSAQTVTLVATTKDGSGNVLSGRAIVWSSTSPSVASVDGNGVVVAAATGTTTVTATSEGKSASATITVNPGAFVGPAGGLASAFSGNVSVTIPAGALASSLAITLAQVASPQPDPKLAPGTAYDFGPTGTTFSSPVTLAIKYDPATLAPGTIQSQLRVHKLIGTTWTPLAGSSVNTTTHVVSGNTSSFSTYAVLEVAIPVATVTITPSPIDLPLGMQVQLTAITKDAQGNVLSGRTVTWGSSANGIATIGTSTGLVTSAAIGATTITATSENVPGTMTVNVRSDPSARTLSVAQGSGTIFVPGRGFVVIPNTYYVNCAIGADQHGYCWGNSMGLGLGVGDGGTVDRAAPTPISLSASLVAITVGGGFACALDISHNAWCWGLNNPGVFGNGAGSVGSTVPVAAGGGKKFIDLSAGEAQVCGIEFGTGLTYCWGRNDLGSLGLGFITPSSGGIVIGTPTHVANDQNFVSISVGVYGACGLTVVGAVYCWGSHQLTVPTVVTPTLVSTVPPFARISHGNDHVCGITMTRQLYCWGDNDYGQLGTGTTAGNASPVLVSGGLSWRFVSAGSYHTCAITTDNRTFCWGQSSSSFASEGQVGNGVTTGSLVPVQVGGNLPPLAVVNAGTAQSCGFAVDGSGYCWGFKGGLGDGDYAYSFGPTKVVGSQNAVDVGRGSPLGCYINTTKQLMCWGETEGETSAQVPSFGALSVKAIATATPGFACVILDSNSHISCWGNNDFGQLGNGGLIAQTAPTPIGSAQSFTSIAAGYRGACAISTLKELVCWGNNSTSPFQPFPAVTNFATIWGADPGGVCAITDAGAAYCGPPGGPLTLVSGPQQWAMMTPGYVFIAFQCGLTTSGDAYCMGNNSNGQLGDGTTNNHATLTPVPGGLKFTQLLVGGNTTCGLTAAGTVYCWGDGLAGQMGSAPAVSSLSPLLIPGGLHFTKLAASQDGFCGVVSDGSVYCWGTRFGSSLGNGERDDRLLPVPMSAGSRFLLYEPGTVNLRGSFIKQP